MVCLVLWVSSGYTKIDSTLVALIGIVALLHMGTIQWKDIAKNTNAVSDNPRALLPPDTYILHLFLLLSGRPCSGWVDLSLLRVNYPNQVHLNF